VPETDAMTLSELCIRRPVMTTLLMLAIAALGIAGYRSLPVAALPRVDFPTIQVSAQLAGASPESMATSVASPLERQLSTIPGVTSMTSSSSQGSVSITLQFDLDRNIDAAANDVQAALSIAQRRLPIEMTSPASYRKVNPADQPVLLLALSSDTVPITEVNDYAESLIAPQISAIKGVAQVQVFGSQKYAVRIELNSQAAAARNLSTNEIALAVAAANANSPVGTISGGDQQWTLDATTQLLGADKYRPLIMAWRNGQPVRLGDVATVRDGTANERQASWYEGKRAVVLAVQRQPDANTVDVVDRILEKLPTYRAAVPSAVSLDVTNDRSQSIREAVADVEHTLMIAIALVIMLIFIFLKSLRATLIPAAAVPLSLIGTCAVMAALGYSIDNMSLLALTLSVGFVVDDAIVMLENIVRHIEMGKKPFQAALAGAREIGFTIISMTISLVAVFIPVLFMGGVVGRIFSEFAVTISIAILISGFVSLTLTPMLCARFLKAHEPARKRGLFGAILDAPFDAMLWAYRISLDGVLKIRWLMLLFTIATVAYTVHLYMVIPKGFFPSEDTGYLTASTEALPEIGFKAMADKQQQAAAIVRQDPAVAYVLSIVGGGNNTSNSGRMFIGLKPKSERDPAPVVVQRLRRATSGVVGLNAFFQAIQNLQIGGRAAKSEYQYTLQSADFQTLAANSVDLVERLQKRPEIKDVTTDLQLSNPQLAIQIDTERAATMGISTDKIRQELYSAFGTRQVATLYTPSNDFAVIMEARPEDRADPTALSRLSVKNSAGQAVPLGSIVTVTNKAGPLSVNHQGQQPAMTIAFNLSPGYALSDAVRVLEEEKAAAGLPETVVGGFAGTAQAFVEGNSSQPLLILAAIVTIYIVLGILYESFFHPITILSGLPSAGLGALLALMYFGMDLSVIAVIGIVMLVGIVKKNAIMMVDFALQEQARGIAPLPAIREACLARFRPIMMTTFAAILGALPIALGQGAGAELRQPLGVAVVGGLLVSQLLTLYITPVVFLALEGLRRRIPSPDFSEAPATSQPSLTPAE
jgi:hydrophobic/amphiphilic exporter-1 (mainly G- bacteria), HAE1 family